MLKRLRIKFICILMSIVATIFCLAFAALIYTTKNSLEKDSLRILHEVSKPEPPFDHFEQKPDKPRLPYFIIQKVKTEVSLYPAVSFTIWRTLPILMAYWNRF